MTPEEIWGQFWQPGTEQQSRYGLLRIDDEGRVSVLFGGEFTEWPTGELGRLASEQRIPVVHGWLNSIPRKITLFDCTTSHRTIEHLAARPAREQTIQPLLALRGAHFDSREEARFESCRFWHDGLSAWINIRQTRLVHDDNRNPSIRMTPSEVVPYRIGTGELGIAVDVSATTNHDGAIMKQRSSMYLTDFTALDWTDWDRLILTPISTLLTLCVGKSVRTTKVTLMSDGVQADVLGRHASNRPTLDGELTPDQILLGFRDLGMRSVGAWLEKVADMGPLPPIVSHFVGDEHKRLTVESRVLEISSALEGLHRRVIDSSKMGYKRRVLAIGSRAERILPGLVGDLQKWARQAEETRNTIIHRENDFLLPDGNFVDRCLIIIESLTFALQAILLSEAGVSEGRIGTAITSTQRWHFFRQRAKDRLPDIYAPST